MNARLDNLLEELERCVWAGRTGLAAVLHGEFAIRSEEARRPVRHPVLRQVLALAQAGASAEEISRLLNARMDRMVLVHDRAQRRWSWLARYAPVVGIPLSVAAILLLLPQGPLSPARLVHPLAWALGILLSSLLLSRLSLWRTRHLASCLGRRILELTLILRAVDGILRQEAPEAVLTRLHGYVQPWRQSRQIQAA